MNVFLEWIYTDYKSSVAAPILSGALASVIALKRPVKPKPAGQKEALLEFLNEKILDRHVSIGGPSRSRNEIRGIGLVILREAGSLEETR